MSARSRTTTAAQGGVRLPIGLARPLDTLFFLLPLILFYELGSLFLNGGRFGSDRVVAFHLIEQCFALLGTTGIWLPAAAVVSILLATHFMTGEPWRVRYETLPKMYAESLALALPLLLLSRAVYLTGGGHAGGKGTEWLWDCVLGVGAGIYEELLFRLIIMTLVIIVASDVLHLRMRWAATIAVIISALLFAGHHYAPVGVESFDWSSFAFRAFAGAYLGVIFIVRGYGPAAGAHAAYNVMVVASAAMFA